MNLNFKKEQLKRVKLLCLQTCHPPIGSKLKQKFWLDFKPPKKSLRGGPKSLLSLSLSLLRWESTTNKPTSQPKLTKQPSSKHETKWWNYIVFFPSPSSSLHKQVESSSSSSREPTTKKSKNWPTSLKEHLHNQSKRASPPKLSSQQPCDPSTERFLTSKVLVTYY